LDNLNKREIEAVAAHELAHIINKDSMLMLVTVVFIGIISLLGHLLIRLRIGGRDSGKAQMFLWMGGLALLALGYIVYPLIRLAISRKREFLADASSVELTKDSEAMISALRKISGRSVVPDAKENIAMFFIDNPSVSKEEVMNLNRPTKTSIRDTHPSIEDRIKALQSI
jgi:heat shock protein HtpX